MREFVRRLLVPMASFALVLLVGYPILVSAPTPPAEAAGTGLALIALATALRRVAVATHAAAERSRVGSLVPQATRSK